MTTIQMTPAKRDHMTGRVSRYAAAVRVVESVETQYTSHGKPYCTTTADGWRDLRTGDHVTADRLNVYRVESINGHGQPVLTLAGVDEEMWGQRV